MDSRPLIGSSCLPGCHIHWQEQRVKCCRTRREEELFSDLLPDWLRGTAYLCNEPVSSQDEARRLHSLTHTTHTTCSPFLSGDSSIFFTSFFLIRILHGESAESFRHQRPVLFIIMSLTAVPESRVAREDWRSNCF